MPLRDNLLMNLSIISHQQRIDYLFERADFFQSDLRMLSEWAGYLCVLVSGLIEESVRTILLDYVQVRAEPPIQRYFEIELKYFQNAKYGKIRSLLENFDTRLSQQLDMQITNEQRNAVDSVVDNRNNISHGKMRGPSFHQVKQWYEDVKVFIGIVDTICKNPPNP